MINKIQNSVCCIGVARLLLLAAMLPALVGCGGSGSRGATEEAAPLMADTAAMRSLEGIWVDTQTEAVVLRIAGDSVFYPDSTSMPVAFAIFGDTLLVDKVRYPIVERGEHLLEYVSLTGETVRLERSTTAEDSLLFCPREYAPILLNEQVSRDTVLFSPSGERYHLYINVNPTRYRVHHTTYTEGGLPMDNVYYDNIIHAAVYQGRRCVFSHDFVKADFRNLVPERFLDEAILSNMQFGPIDLQGCSFHATLCHPDGASCYVAVIQVDFDGRMSLNLLEY